MHNNKPVDDTTLMLKKQLAVLRNMLKTEAMIVSVIRASADSPLTHMLSKRLNKEYRTIKHRIQIVGRYVQVIASFRTYEDTEGSVKTVPKYVYDFEIVLDEYRKIDAPATIRNIRSMYYKINQDIDTIESCMNSVRPANDEWEEIREKIKAYREKYPVWVQRTDIY